MRGSPAVPRAPIQSRECRLACRGFSDVEAAERVRRCRALLLHAYGRAGAAQARARRQCPGRCGSVGSRELGANDGAVSLGGGFGVYFSDGAMPIDRIAWLADVDPGTVSPGNLRGPERDAETEREQDQRAGGARRAPQILSGQHGGSWFEVVASIVTEVKDPGIAPIDFQVDGRTGTIKVGDVMESSFAPIKNPMTGEDETVQVAIPGGLEYSRGNGVAEILQSRVLRSTDEIAVDLAGRRHPSPAARRRCPPRCAGAPR
jgi:hypothetical protein